MLINKNDIYYSNIEHGVKTSQKMGVEVLENEIILEGELRKDPVISKIRLNNPRDKSTSNFGKTNKSANEGLKLNRQSKVIKPETPFNDRQKYAERVNIVKKKIFKLKVPVFDIFNRNVTTLQI